MATQGPRFPGFVTTEIGPSGDNDWLNPSNVGADDAAEAQITAATYDANDHSWRLRASDFGFTIPTGSTIDGITVEIERRAFAGAAEDQEVRLFDDAGNLVGDDKQKATAWPSTPTIDTYGGAADDWLPTGSWTPAQINNINFGVALIVLATAANTDIGVDFVRITATYTPPPLSATRGLVSWTEFQTPLVPTRGQVSFTEFEAPIAPTRGLVSWTELQAPIAPTRGLVSWAEFEVPAVATRGLIAWAEFQVPDASLGPYVHGTVKVRYVVGQTANVVPVETVESSEAGVIPVREYEGNIEIVPVREAPTETPRVKVRKV